MCWRNILPPCKKVKLSLCLTKHYTHHEGIWGNGCIDPHFLDLGSSWRWVVSFTPWPLYPVERSPSILLYMRLGGLQNWCGQCGEEKILAPIGTWALPLSCLAHNQSRYWSHYPGSCCLHVQEQRVSQQRVKSGWRWGLYEYVPLKCQWTGTGLQHHICEDSTQHFGWPLLPPSSG
jgi:hypothetical protein